MSAAKRSVLEWQLHLQNRYRHSTIFRLCLWTGSDDAANCVLLMTPARATAWARGHKQCPGSPQGLGTSSANFSSRWFLAIRLVYDSFRTHLSLPLRSQVVVSLWLGCCWWPVTGSLLLLLLKKGMPCQYCSVLASCLNYRSMWDHLTFSFIISILSKRRTISAEI